MASSIAPIMKRKPNRQKEKREHAKVAEIQTPFQYGMCWTGIYVQLVSKYKTRWTAKRGTEQLSHFMHTHLYNAVQKAIANLSHRNIAKIGAAEFELHILFPVQSWKPHPSVFSTDSIVIGEDSCGNLFLMASDGSIRFWDHESEDETTLSASLETFLDSLSAPTPIVLKPDQIKRGWIDPTFLEEQRTKGNAK
jgi:hypothetical protein